MATFVIKGGIDGRQIRIGGLGKRPVDPHPTGLVPRIHGDITKARFLLEEALEVPNALIFLKHVGPAEEFLLYGPKLVDLKQPFALADLILFAGRCAEQVLAAFPFRVAVPTPVLGFGCSYRNGALRLPDQPEEKRFARDRIDWIRPFLCYVKGRGAETYDFRHEVNPKMSLLLALPSGLGLLGAGLPDRAAEFAP